MLAARFLISRAALAGTMLAAGAVAAPGQPRTVENAGGATVAVAHLVAQPDDMCVPETFQARVVARAFDRRGIKLTGVMLAYADGMREFVNVELPPDLDRAPRERVLRGLRRLSAIGRLTSGRLFRCGAGGQVLNLDTIR